MTSIETYRERKAALARTPEHREKRRLYMLKWRERNREKYNADRRAYHERTKEQSNARQQERHYQTSYGISKAEKLGMVEAQGGKCRICDKPFPSQRHTHVDHCHETGKVRGILCHVCNTKLGWFETYRSRVEDYLK